MAVAIVQDGMGAHHQQLCVDKRLAIFETRPNRCLPPEDYVLASIRDRLRTRAGRKSSKTFLHAWRRWRKRSPALLPGMLISLRALSVGLRHRLDRLVGQPNLVIEVAKLPDQRRKRRAHERRQQSSAGGDQPGQLASVLWGALGR